MTPSPMSPNGAVPNQGISLPELTYYKIRAARAEVRLLQMQLEKLEGDFTTLLRTELLPLLPDGRHLADYELDIETRTLAPRSAQEVGSEN